MTITAELREHVRRGANFACEFCGVTETDTSISLTIDHFQPTTKGGDDSLDNLLYCCMRCNQYKLDYWPADPDAPTLWNPRREPAAQHFFELDDGTLVPLSPTGDFTLRRLRPNRAPLVAYRARRRQQAEHLRLLTRYHEVVQLLEHLHTQLGALLEEQQQLLAEQRTLLQLLRSRSD